MTSLLELTNKTCRWPIGHPKEAGFHFCGETPVAGLPYCASHTHIAYRGKPVFPRPPSLNGRVAKPYGGYLGQIVRHSPRRKPSVDSGVSNVAELFDGHRARQQRLWNDKSTVAQPEIQENLASMRKEIDCIKICLAEIALRPIPQAEGENEAAELRKINARIIIKLVANFCGIAMTDIISQRRMKAIVRARQIAYYLCRHLTDRSFPEIGRRLGGRDHSSVLHGVRKIEALMLSDSELEEDIRKLCAALGRKVPVPGFSARDRAGRGK